MSLAATPALPQMPEPLTESSTMTQSFRGKRITRIFVARGRLSEAQAREAEQRTLTSGISLTQYLRESGWVSADDILEALSLQSGFPIIDFAGRETDAAMVKFFKPRVLVTYQFVPYEHLENVVCIAVDTPLSPALITALEQRFGVKLLVALAPQNQIQARLSSLRPQDNRRRSPRYDTVLPLILCPADGEAQEIHALTVNISDGGVMFQTRTNLCAFNPGMKFTLAEPRRPVTGLGVIRQFYRDTERVGERWIGRMEFLEVEKHGSERRETAAPASEPSVAPAAERDAAPHIEPHEGT